MFGIIWFYFERIFKFLFFPFLIREIIVYGETDSEYLLKSHRFIISFSGLFRRIIILQIDFILIILLQNLIRLFLLVLL